MEEAYTANIGSRTYRFYQIQFPTIQLAPFSNHKLSLLNEDDAQSQEQGFNVDIANFQQLLEEMAQQFKQQKQKQDLTKADTIYFDSYSKSYTLYTKFTNRDYFQTLIGFKRKSKPDILVRIQSQTKSVISGNIRDLSIEIKAFSPENVIQADHVLDIQFNKHPSLRVNQYKIVDQQTREVLKTVTPQKTSPDIPVQQEKSQLEEYPDLQIDFQRGNKKFVHRARGVSQDTINFLLGNKAQNMKVIRSSLRNRVDLYIEKKKSSLQIKGPTEKDVKQGYAAFIRLVKAQKPDLQIFKAQQSDYTHFLALNLAHNPDLARTQQEVLSMVRNSNQQGAVPSTQYHITLAMLDLNQPKDIVNTLESFEQEVKKISGGQKLSLVADRVGFFGTPKNPHVLTLELLFNDDYRKLNRIHFFLLKGLLQQGILAQNEPMKQKFVMEENSVKYSYHVTLYRKQRDQQIDVGNLFVRKGNVRVPFEVRSIDLLSRTKEHPADPYPVVYSFKWANQYQVVLNQRESW